MLTLCPTPIGNLDDVSPRQFAALRDADVVACEDSRVTGKLFELLGIPRPDGKPRFVSYHEHNESERAPELVAMVAEGLNVVLVSDAGMPAISDPGYRLVRATREAGLEVQVLPGAVAATLAVAGSGLPSDRWIFEGFAPQKSGQRQKALERAAATGATAVFYESPHRIDKFLDGVAAVYGPEHEVCVARELTKMHEEWMCGAATEVAAHFRERARGEMVVVLAPREATQTDDVDGWIAALLAANVHPKAIKSAVADVTGLKKGEIFDRIERLKR